MALHYDILNTHSEMTNRRGYGLLGRESPCMHRSDFEHSHERLPMMRIPTEITHNQSNVKPRIIINISGKRYETYDRTLKAKSYCLLAREERQKYFDKERGEYFFDRNPKVFEAILTYFQSGLLAKPDSIPEKIYLDDLKFFGLDRETADFYKGLVVTDTAALVLPSNVHQRRLWELMEYPDTSKSAKIVSLFSTFIILISIVAFCVETLPQFNEKQQTDKAKQARHTFYILEACCVGWFTIEYLLRFLGSPQKIKFLYHPLNIVDLAAILPFYITLALDKSSQGGGISSLAVLRILRLVRVFRIFKLSRYSKALQLLLQTIYSSANELLLLLFFLSIIIILYSSAVYFFEASGSPNQDFPSIPHTFWLGMVTITTVGYGDVVPKTLGK